MASACLVGSSGRSRMKMAKAGWREESESGLAKHADEEGGEAHKAREEEKYLKCQW